MACHILRIISPANRYALPGLERGKKLVSELLGFGLNLKNGMGAGES